MGLGFEKNCVTRTAPITIPPTKKRFHISFFQSYLKKGILAGRQAAQTCLSDDDIPKALLPMSKSNGTISPIKGPATYQGQGCFIHSIKFISFSFYLEYKVRHSKNYNGDSCHSVKNCNLLLS